jgi:hypothetical protein
MICPVCKKEGTTSRVVRGHSSSTLVHYEGYYDEQGKYHSDDPNTTTTDYKCSNGHRFEVAVQRGKETITIISPKPEKDVQEKKIP